MFPLHSPLFHTFAKKQQKEEDMKKKDGMTGWLMKCSSSCLIFMGCSLMIMGFCLLLTGCTEKAKKMEKKNIKVETIKV